MVKIFDETVLSVMPISNGPKDGAEWTLSTEANEKLKPRRIDRSFQNQVLM